MRLLELKSMVDQSLSPPFLTVVFANVPTSWVERTKYNSCTKLYIYHTPKYETTFAILVHFLFLLQVWKLTCRVYIRVAIMPKSPWTSSIISSCVEKTAFNPTTMKINVTTFMKTCVNFTQNLSVFSKSRYNDKP